MSSGTAETFLLGRCIVIALRAEKLSRNSNMADGLCFCFCRYTGMPSALRLSPVECETETIGEDLVGCVEA